MGRGERFLCYFLPSVHGFSRSLSRCDRFARGSTHAWYISDWEMYILSDSFGLVNANRDCN